MRNQHDNPIIQSLVDVDVYKATMAHFALAMGHYEMPMVKLSLVCRTVGADLGHKIDIGQLREEINHVKTLCITPNEMDFIERLPYISPLTDGPFYHYFANQLGQFVSGTHVNSLPNVNIETHDDKLLIETEGYWFPTSWWETIILSIVSELRIRHEVKASGRTIEDYYRVGLTRLDEKIDFLLRHPEVRFMDFGTRRRASRAWHERVLDRLLERIPGSVTGTSNINLARLRGLKPMGTQAHELFQVYSGIYHDPVENLIDSHNRVLRDWYHVYGGPLSIALTDTYGTRFFWKQFTPEQAVNWWGLRHDSADPFAFGEAAIAFYTALRIDTRGKMIVFSDNLTADLMVRLADRFRGAIDTGFGWGTNLTNDLGIPGVSLAMKVVKANGHYTVKLSDNIAKSVGQEEDIARFKKIFGYTGGSVTPCLS